MNIKQIILFLTHTEFSSGPDYWGVLSSLAAWREVNWALSDLGLEVARQIYKDDPGYYEDWIARHQKERDEIIEMLIEELADFGISNPDLNLEF
jgi:hypothetical protein